MTTLFWERTAWRRHPWSVFAVFQTTLTNWSLVWDLLMLKFFWDTTASFESPTRFIAMAFWTVWVILLCRLVKYIGLFSRHPEDLKWIPVIPLFGYCHSVWFKPGAMFTIGETAWGSREGADGNDNGRMIPLPGYTEQDNPNKSNEGISDYKDEMFIDETTPFLPRYHNNAPSYDAPNYGTLYDGTRAMIWAQTVV